MTVVTWDFADERYYEALDHLSDRDAQALRDAQEEAAGFLAEDTTEATPRWDLRNYLIRRGYPDWVAEQAIDCLQDDDRAVITHQDGDEHVRGLEEVPLP